MPGSYYPLLWALEHTGWREWWLKFTLVGLFQSFIRMNSKSSTSISTEYIKPEEALIERDQKYLHKLNMLISTFSF